MTNVAKELLGKPVADAITERVAERVAELQAHGITPSLAIVRVGERADDLSYERGATKRADALGIQVRVFALPETVSQEELLATIHRVNEDDSLHGCLLFRPLPAHLDEEAACQALLPAKDVDGITAASLASVFTGMGEGFPPCTAAACIELLDFYRIPLEGARVTVVGRSLVIGKPVACLLLQRNATVTIAHSRTADLPALCQESDLVVCATGRAQAYGSAHFRPGQTVLDVGINVSPEGQLCGDVHFEEAAGIVNAITPVPRGVGSVTTAVLMQHVAAAASM